MKAETLDDQQLVDAIRHSDPVHQQLIDEYYRRCIPIYLDFIGIYWHTGYYMDDDQGVTPDDQTRMIRVIADSIELKAQDRVLDVGCGIGSTACYLAQNYRCHVHGLTPVEDQIALARQLIERANLGSMVHIDRGHAAQLPYPDNTFDVILFFESPCHFSDRDRFFQEACRVLKPGGRLAGEDWLTGHGPLGENQPDKHVQTICKDWAIPVLGSGASYLNKMRAAGFESARYIDMRSEMPLEKGFSVTSSQQEELQAEIRHCQSPLLKLTLQGLLSLGKAITADAFTIGRFTALNPTPEDRTA